MKCRICQNEEGNISFTLKEMMYGFRDPFKYFQCAACDCIQIVSPPADMNKYYPGDYYSYTTEKSVKRSGLFQRLQCRSIIRGNTSLVGKLITYKYMPPDYYQTLKHLQLFSFSSPVLDVGSGSGELLKSFYKAGYKDLTGIDPYIEKDIVYNENLRIEKKNLFEMDQEFDAIMLNHSLEHMDHQLEVLKKLYSLLSKKGRLLIRIPIVSKPLMEEYGLNVVSLDAPRHFYIHSFKSITVFEIRPRFDKPEEKREHPVAKTTFVKAKNHWKVFWMRANLNWHSYTPKPTVKTVKEFCKLVEEDKHNCFFG